MKKNNILHNLTSWSIKLSTGFTSKKARRKCLTLGLSILHLLNFSPFRNQPRKIIVKTHLFKKADISSILFDMEDLLLINKIHKVPLKEQVPLLINSYPSQPKRIRSIKLCMSRSINAKLSTTRHPHLTGNLCKNKRNVTIDAS